MRYRVVVWSTGAVGTAAAKAVIENPDLELVGCFVYNPDKAGRDVGEIIAVPATGVLATSDRAEILALDADVVIHAPKGHPWPMDEHDADVCALLRSGKNVISCVGYHSPPLYGPDYVAMLQAAGTEGGATLYGTGVDPDLFLNRIPATVTSMCTDIKKITMAEVCFMPHHPNADMVCDTLGIGKTPTSST